MSAAPTRGSLVVVFAVVAEFLIEVLFAPIFAPGRDASAWRKVVCAVAWLMVLTIVALAIALSLLVG